MAEAGLGQPIYSALTATEGEGPLSATTDAWESLSAGWRRRVEGRLEPGEVLLAGFEPDLDRRLHFAPGLVLLTDRRVLAAEGPAPEVWSSWRLGPEVDLSAVDQGGAGTLEVLGPSGRLACWRYSAGRAGAAQRLVQRLAALRAGRDAETSVCPSCGAVIRPEAGGCAGCSAGPAQAPVSALYRLAGVARARARLIVLGFALTLAGTVVALIPPYLTMPLLDR